MSATLIWDPRESVEDMVSPTYGIYMCVQTTTNEGLREVKVYFAGEPRYPIQVHIKWTLDLDPCPMNLRFKSISKGR